MDKARLDGASAKESEREEIISLAAEIELRCETARRLRAEAEANSEEAEKMEEILEKMIVQEFGKEALETIKEKSDYRSDKDFREGIIAEYIAEHPDQIIAMGK